MKKNMSIMDEQIHREEKKADQCEGCAYRKKGNKRSCMAFIRKPKNCWNNTTKEEFDKREKEIQFYYGNQRTLYKKLEVEE